MKLCLKYSVFLEILPENEVGGCKGTEFGCCPDGETEAEGPEFFGCQVKDRIPTGSCVEAEYGCCLDGVTAAQGPFNAGCPYFTCKVGFQLKTKYYNDIGSLLISFVGDVGERTQVVLKKISRRSFYNFLLVHTIHVHVV